MKDRIKELRMALGYSQAEFAERLKAARNTVYYWEAGTKVPTPRMVDAICDTFGVSYTWLTDGVGDMFVDIPSNLIEDLSIMYKLSEAEMRIVKTFIELPPAKRQAFLEFLDAFTKEKG